MTSLAKPAPDLVRPRARAALDAIAPYEPGMTPERARRRLGPRDFAKLSSNENPLGPSPAAIAAASRALISAASYPDSTSMALRQALASHLERPVERVTAGPGSEALIDYFFR